MYEYCYITATCQGRLSDVDIWAALDNVRMKKRVAELELGLDTECTNGGENFSLGERQLLSMA